MLNSGWTPRGASAKRPGAAVTSGREARQGAAPSRPRGRRSCGARCRVPGRTRAGRSRPPCGVERAAFEDPVHSSRRAWTLSSTPRGWAGKERTGRRGGAPLLLNREWRFPVQLQGFPVRLKKFPVRLRREFVSNCLDPFWNLRRIRLCEGRNRRNSLYFPCRTGNEPQRRVRTRLPPPPLSPSFRRLFAPWSRSRRRWGCVRRIREGRISAANRRRPKGRNFWQSGAGNLRRTVARLGAWGARFSPVEIALAVDGFTPGQAVSEDPLRSIGPASCPRLVSDSPAGAAPHARANPSRPDASLHSAALRDRT